MRSAAIKYQDKLQNGVIFVISIANLSTLFLQKRCQNESSGFRSNHDDSVHNHPFTFTGKEKDAETGYGYFGARYYDSDLSGLFMSVDPMVDKYPNISPYAYCAWNPLRLVDPDGRKIKGVTYNENTGEYTFTDDALKNGLDKYINIRTQTKNGKKSIEQMINDEHEFDVKIIDNPLFVNENGNYYQLNGITIGNQIIISTCLDKKSGEVFDAMVVDPDNNIYNRTVIASE